MTLWDEPAPIWRYHWQRYDTVCASKHAELPALEKFVFSTLPSSARSRNDPHVNSSEYSKLVTWKLKRGKNRPRLQAYADALLESDVVTASASAISKMQVNEPGPALQPLLKLRGCGPATASALLAALSTNYPFMSDELLTTTLGTTKYTVSAYVQLFRMTQDKVLQLSTETKADGGGSWTARDVERAVFAYMNGTSTPSKSISPPHVDSGNDGKGDGLEVDGVSPGKKIRSSHKAQKRTQDVPVTSEDCGENTTNSQTPSATPTAPRRSKRLKPH